MKSYEMFWASGAIGVLVQIQDNFDYHYIYYRQNRNDPTQTEAIILKFSKEIIDDISCMMIKIETSLENVLAHHPAQLQGVHPFEIALEWNIVNILYSCIKHFLSRNTTMFNHNRNYDIGVYCANQPYLFMERAFKRLVDEYSKDINVEIFEPVYLQRPYYGLSYRMIKKAEY